MTSNNKTVMIAIGVICLFIVLAWDGIVIFFLDGDINNIYAEDWEEPEQEKYPECKENCSLCGSDYCIYKCWAEQIWRKENDKAD